MLRNAPTTPSLSRRFGRAAYRFLGLLALLSAIAGGPFAYLAWVEAKSSGSDQAAMVHEIKELRKIAALSLEREEERLVLHRAMLASLEPLLPEAEKTRLGIEKLARLLDSRIEGVRAERGRLKAGGQLPPPAATSLWSPDSEPSRTARKIWEEMIDRP
jgi:hypothetical protein